MKKMTIAKAFAELKTLRQRIEKKQAFITSYLGRPSKLPWADGAMECPDPLADQGGSEEVIGREVQSARDLMLRVVKIRTAIMKENLLHMIDVAGKKQTVYEALVWRREVAGLERSFWSSLANKARDLSTMGRAGLQRQASKDVVDVEALIAYPPAKILEEQERIDKALGELDGNLSVYNSLTEIEIED